MAEEIKSNKPSSTPYQGEEIVHENKNSQGEDILGDKPKADAGEKKSAGIEINQVNKGRTVSRMENTTNLLLGEKYDAIRVEISSNNSIEQRLISFGEFIKRDYPETKTQSRDYINFQFKRVKIVFSFQRILVINNSLPDQELALDLVELAGFANSRKGNVYCATIDLDIIGADKIVEEFLDSKSGDAEARKVAKTLVVYSSSRTGGSTRMFFDFLIKRSGSGDSFCNRLVKENIFLVFVVNDKDLLGLRPVHFSLIQLDLILIYLFDQISRNADAVELLELVENSIYNYGWLSNNSQEEKKQQILELVEKRKLKEILESRLKGVDKEEEELLIKKLKKPVYKPLLFAAGFFEGIRMSEFSSLMKLILRQKRVGEAKEANDPANLISEWEEQADEILAECGIIIEANSKGHSSLKFESRARRDIARNYFLDRYRFFLSLEFDNMEREIIHSPETISTNFLHSLFDFALLNAKNDPQKYITGLSIRLGDLATNPDLSEKDLKVHFHRLRFFVVKKVWDSEFRIYLSGFYHHMLANSDRRSILAPLLSYMAEPGKDDCLELLRRLLNSSGDDEIFIRRRLTPVIIYNYLGELNLVFSAINSWQQQSTETMPGGAFYFAFSSIMLVFYDRKFSIPRDSDLDHRIIESCLRDKSGKVFVQLLEIIFSSHCQKIFDSASLTNNAAQINDSSSKENVQSKTNYLTYSFLLTRMHYLIDKCDETGENVEVFFKLIEDKVKLRLDTRSICRGLVSVASLFGDQIIIESRSAKPNPNLKEFLKESRDVARWIAKQFGSYDNSINKKYYDY